MKSFVFIIFLFTQFVSAQNKRFIYQYTFIPDSTNKADIIKDFMFLDRSGDRSLFYSRYKFAEDSTSIEEGKKGQFYIPKADIIYRVEKNNDKVFLLTNDYGLGKIKVEDDRKINWEIKPDKQKIGAYNAQKAITDFGGRKWIAWFTTDVPIQDGPYKFSGLPGLIVKMEDTTGSHMYELTGIKNLSGETKYTDLNSGKKTLPLTQGRFKELFILYRKDPVADMRKLKMEGRIIDYTDSSGNFHTAEQIVKDAEKLITERIKKDNNIIEIDLLKAVQ